MGLEKKTEYAHHEANGTRYFIVRIERRGNHWP